MLKLMEVYEVYMYLFFSIEGFVLLYVLLLGQCTILHRLRIVSYALCVWTYLDRALIPIKALLSSGALASFTYAHNKFG